VAQDGSSGDGDGDSGSTPALPPLPPLFLGTHQPRLDDKGRLFLPARFRDDLAAGLVITRGQERCLYVFPHAEFARMQAQIRQAPVTSKVARDFTRVLMSGAIDGVPDKQGRVTVPPLLRQYAGLSKDCVVVGVGARLEIWDAPTWDAYLAEQEPAFAEQSEEVLPGLI
jgi:MraZ protein